MFVTGPPEPPGDGGLRVTRADRRLFGGASELATDPSIRPYLTDMVAPYGLDLREDVFAAAAGHSYGEMAEPLIEALVPADDPVDLLVMAYAVHDVRLGRCTSTYLSGRCPGNPLAFALCDQGVAAPFSALRTIAAYAASGGCRRALLLVLEQSALHYELARPAPLPDRHAAVGLVFEWSAEAGPITVRQHNLDEPDEPDAAARALAAELALLPAADGPPTTLVLGAGLAARWGGHPTVDGPLGEVVIAPVGRPCTGVWWELAARLPDWQAGGRRVVLAEHDPVLGGLSTAVLRVDAAPTRSEPDLPGLPAGMARQSRAGV